MYMAKKSERLTIHGKNIYHYLVNGGYVRGWGAQMRIMDANHNPIFNCPKLDFEFVKPYCKLSGIVWVLGKPIPKTILDVEAKH
jgi:hypothetical protein